MRYLPQLLASERYRGKQLLEVGCGVGTDLVRFARAGANVTGIDLAETSIDLARKNFAQNGLQGKLQVMNGEAMSFADNSFDVVYARLRWAASYSISPRRRASPIAARRSAAPRRHKQRRSSSSAAGGGIRSSSPIP